MGVSSPFSGRPTPARPISRSSACSAGHNNGIIGLPLRLLAREIYDRIAAACGRNRVALVTGEEKIVPANASYVVCTVEAMPLDRDFAFVAVDEIQLAADPERGHVFTDRLLNARGYQETMFLGSETIRPLIKKLVPRAEFVTRPPLFQTDVCPEPKSSRVCHRARPSWRLPPARFMPLRSWCGVTAAVPPSSSAH